MVYTNYAKYFWLFILSAILLPSDSFANQFAWVDYRNAFTENIKVCSSRQANIAVDIPSNILKTNSDHIILVVLIQNHRSGSYVDHWLHFNSHRYSIPNKVLSGNQTVEIKIKTKHFKAGKNIIKASTSYRQQFSVEYCGYEIKKMYFKELSSPSTELAISSNPSIVENIKGTSPFLLKTTQLKSINAEKNRDAIAVVIGNQTYESKDIPPVSFAINDASAIKKYLIDTLGYKDGNIIQNTNASKADLEMIFGTERNYKGMLYNYIKPQKSDVFIYYSGHGSPDPNTNKAYLVPTDCNPTMMDLTAYPLDILYGNLPKIEAKRVTVVIDACFSGGTNTGKWLIPNASPALLKVINPVTAQNNLTILTSAENNQVSSWYPEKQHSLFTYFFLKAVTGDADLNQNKQITFQEIYNFVADRAEGVPYYAKRLHGGRTQTPTMQAADNDAVFVKY